MQRRRFLRLLGLSTAGLALAGRRVTAAPARPPNILFFFSDDHAWQAISAYGSRVNRTPHIDRLADQGARFDHCFCTNSICAPSRAVALTGTYSHVNGVVDNGPSSRFDGSQFTYPQALRSAGYQTAMFGKWHLQTDPTGFDHWEVLPGQGVYYDPPFLTAGGRKQYPGYVTEIITDLALGWLRDGWDRSKPFLLHVWHKAPHRNWQPGPREFGLYRDTVFPEPATLFDDYAGRTSSAADHAMGIRDHLTLDSDLKLTATPPPGLSAERLQAWNEAYASRNEAFRQANLQGDALVRWKYQEYLRDYLRCVAGVDASVGRVLDWLQAEGLEDNTLVVYSSDQGFYLGEHGWFDKRWMYEESFRMPLLVRWPGVTKPGTRVRPLAQNTDFAPTFLEAAGAAVPPEVQGRSLLPLLKGETPADWRRSVYYHYYEYPAPHHVRPHVGVRTERHKLIHFYTVDEWELFDLEKDPAELRSLYGDPASAPLVAELKLELARLQKLYGDEDYRTPPAPRQPPAVVDAEFAGLHGVRRIARPAPGTVEITADDDGAYALKRAQTPFRQQVVLRCRLRSAVTEGVRNGLIAFGPEAQPGAVLRCGVYIGARQVVILANGNQAVAQKPWGDATQADAEFEVAVTVSLVAHTVSLTVGGQTLDAPLPADWKEIAWYGYGLNRTATRFTVLEVSGR